MDDPVERLERAARDRRAARERVEAVGEETLRDLEAACADLRAILDAYEDRAVGDGDFAGFIEFQERIATFTADLPADLPERDGFEAIDDLLQQRRLTEDDYADARERLAGVEGALEPLRDRETAEQRFRDALNDCRTRVRELRETAEDLERLRRLGEADLDAPVDRIREPIEQYDAAVREAFERFRTGESAREVLDLVATTRHYPLVPFRTPPADLHSYVESREVGGEPIPTLLEYAGYSRSKLDHYVDDPGALHRAVRPHRTYLDGLDAEPLTVGWPPPSADVLWWQCRERIAVVGRFAPDVVALLRTVRDRTRDDEYRTLRESAVAGAELSAAERTRIRDGAVERELATVREERERIEEALERHGPG